MATSGTRRWHEAQSAAAVEQSRAATYPPPYPEAWYVIGRSQDFGDGPTFVRAVGKEWVVFRDRSGRPQTVDAYCPHLGANLADGTRVGDAVECPFHGWRIRGDGGASPRSGSASAGGRRCTTAWSTDELHGWVVVYHRSDPEPGPPPEPPYRLQRCSGIDKGELVYRGEHDAGLVGMHLLEFVENSVDFQHFAPIHGKLRLPWTGIPVPKMTIEHEASWRRDPDESHVCWFRNEATLAFDGNRIDGSGANADVRLEGPGSIVRFEFTLSRGDGRVVLYQSHTPVGPLSQHVRFRWFSDRSVPRPLAWFIVGNWVAQWRRDIGIWERKIYRDAPLLSRDDGPVHPLRRWYAQFYPSP